MQKSYYFFFKNRVTIAVETNKGELPMGTLVIGADGGGTKTALVALELSENRIVSQSEALGCNSYDCGRDTAAERVLDGIKALHLSPEDRVLAIGLGDPAMDDSLPDASLLKEALQEKLSFPVFAVSDVFAALYAYTKGEAGALLIAGTGSMGLALQEKALPPHKPLLFTVGGWGLPTADGGSAYAIAVQAIGAAFDAFDGIAPPTLLCQALQERYGVSAPRGLIEVFNGTPRSRSEIASFAKEVDRCAKEGDATARELLHRAGNTLGRYGIALLEGLPREQRRLGLFGSVMQKNQSVRDTLITTVKERFPEAEVGVSPTSPAVGAALYAVHAIGATK